ncbi:hypothetical protein ACIRU2_10080 [Streptomyces sp. NPDC101169]|uniref:hypothetical protein n=1 Tax=Streptomyces sp. NPDC101169 TaxID=3366121 RepID=UPI0037FA1772
MSDLVIRLRGDGPDTSAAQRGQTYPRAHVVQDMGKDLANRFPSLSDVAIEQAWGGWIGISPDWLAIAGQVFGGACGVVRDRPPLLQGRRALRSSRRPRITPDGGPAFDGRT